MADERRPMNDDAVDSNNQDRQQAPPQDEVQVELERRARRHGWVPQDQWHGEGEWRDAKQFLEVADSVNPLLRANNRKLEGALTAQEQRVKALEEELAASRESIEALKEIGEEMATRAAQQTRDQLAADLKAARESGDTAAEVEILAKIGVTAKPPEPKAPPKADPPKPKGPVLTPEQQAIQEQFLTDHGWFKTDMRMAAYCNAELAEIMKTPEGQEMSVQERLDTAAQRTEEFFNGAQRRQASRVNGSRPSAQRTAGRSFADIPPADQAACNEQAKRLVGPGRAYKTLEDWQKRYATLYFREDWGTHQGAARV